MRILYLNPSGQLGGAEVFLADALEALRKAYPDWQLEMIVGGEGVFTERVRALGVSVKVKPMPAAIAGLGETAMIGSGGLGGMVRMGTMAPRLAGPMISYIREMRRAIREFSPDLIHTNGLKMHVLGLWAKPPKIPLIWHVQDFVGERPLMRRVCAAHARYCQGAIAISNSVAEDLLAVCGPKMRVHKMYNVVNAGRFTPQGARLDLDSLCGMDAAPEGTTRVGLLGTFARWKGHEVFLKALAKLKHLRLRGYVIGDAIYQTANSQYSRTELAGKALEMGISGRVGFTGFVKDTAAAIRSLDIVVHASTRPEPLGMVIIEAQACGRPVIISRAGGAAEIIEEGLSGLGVPPNDVDGVAAAIETLVRDPERRAAMGQAARRNVETRFEIGTVAGKLREIYSDSIRDARTAPV